MMMSIFLLLKTKTFLDRNNLSMKNPEYLTEARKIKV